MNWLRIKKLVGKLWSSIRTDNLKTNDQIKILGFISNFLKNGFSLNEALDFYQSVTPKRQASVQRLRHRLSFGDSFANAIRPLINDNLYYQLRIAELHGNLVAALDDVSNFLKVKKRQQDRILGLLTYPAFLAVLLVTIITGIHIFILPQLATFNHTQARSYHWLIIGGVTCLLIGIIWLLVLNGRRLSKLKKVNLLLKCPLIGKVFREYYAYYFASNLALMLECGMSLKQITTFMTKFTPGSLIANLGHEINELIVHGRKVTKVNLRYHFLPKQMMVLIDNGDSTAVLAQKLRSYSKLCFSKMVKKSEKLIGLIQPLMFLTIGLVIMMTYLSMLLPMYNSIKGVY